MPIDVNFIQNSFIIILITYFIAFAFQIYMMYLNWKQSKVNNQMAQLIVEVREIKEIIKKKKR